MEIIGNLMITSKPNIVQVTSRDLIISRRKNAAFFHQGL